MNRNSNSKEILNAVVVSLFFSIFLFTYYLTIKDTASKLLDGTHKIYWKKTAAIINEVDLAEVDNYPLDHELRGLFLDKKCNISYMYSFNYKIYTGTTIGRISKKIDRDDFEIKLFNKLKNVKTCYIWVNSNHPQESQLILDRPYYISLLVVNVFILLFILMAFYSAIFSKKIIN